MAGLSETDRSKAYDESALDGCIGHEVPADVNG
jgi:hypothetical protein